MFFEDEEQGLAYVRENLPGAEIAEKKEAQLFYGETQKDFSGYAISNLPNFDQESELAKKFFTAYYGGCGGCYHFFLAEFPTGEVLFPFDLD
jgi:hypothetical protein